MFHCLTPDYLVLLGSIDVDPHQPCATRCTTASTTSTSSLPATSPTRATRRSATTPPTSSGLTGRRPDPRRARRPRPRGAPRRPRHAATWTPLPRKDFEDHLGITAKEWSARPSLSLRKLFGAAELHTSPHDGPAWSVPLLDRRVHFINCHGAEGDPQFYGQLESAYPVSVRAKAIAGHVTPGTIVAAECCYGGQLWAATATAGHEPIPIAYLRSGAVGFVGSSTIAYGPADAQQRRRPPVPVLPRRGAGRGVARASTARGPPAVRAGVTVLSPVNTRPSPSSACWATRRSSPVPRTGDAKAAPRARRRGASARERLLEHAIANLRDTSVTRRVDAPVGHESPARLAPACGRSTDARPERSRRPAARWRRAARPPAHRALDAEAHIRTRARPIRRRPAEPARSRRRGRRGAKEDGQVVTRRVLASR